MSAARQNGANGVRKSILELAPLECHCMNALWPLGEATVQQIREALVHTRPRAYTTIMTIMDRLARKGVVERRKSGRAWLYRANLTAHEARRRAVAQVVESFFGGSPEELAAHLSGTGSQPVLAAAADRTPLPSVGEASLRPKPAAPSPKRATEPSGSSTPTPALDATLL